jgi:hypothetical protein
MESNSGTITKHEIGKGMKGSNQRCAPGHTRIIIKRRQYSRYPGQKPGPPNMKQSATAPCLLTAAQCHAETWLIINFKPK